MTKVSVQLINFDGVLTVRLFNETANFVLRGDVNSCEVVSFEGVDSYDMNKLTNSYLNKVVPLFSDVLNGKKFTCDYCHQMKDIETHYYTTWGTGMVECTCCAKVCDCHKRCNCSLNIKDCPQCATWQYSQRMGGKAKILDFCSCGKRDQYGVEYETFTVCVSCTNMPVTVNVIASCQFCYREGQNLKLGLIPMNDKPFCADEIEAMVCVDEVSCKEERARVEQSIHEELSKSSSNPSCTLCGDTGRVADDIMCWECEEPLAVSNPITDEPFDILCEECQVAGAHMVWCSNHFSKQSK